MRRAEWLGVEILRGMVQQAAVIQRVRDLFETPNYLKAGVDQGETSHAPGAAFKAAADTVSKFPSRPQAFVSCPFCRVLPLRRCYGPMPHQAGMAAAMTGLEVRQ